MLKSVMNESTLICAYAGKDCYVVFGGVLVIPVDNETPQVDAIYGELGTLLSICGIRLEAGRCIYLDCSYTPDLLISAEDFNEGAVTVLQKILDRAPAKVAYDLRANITQNILINNARYGKELCEDIMSAYGSYLKV